jgi:hypothetical protein
MLGADKPDPKKACAEQAQGCPKAPSAKATDAHPGHHGGGQFAHHHPGAKDGHAKGPKATADGKCPYCHQLLASKGHHKGQKAHHGKGKGHKGWGGHGHKGHHGKCGFGHHGKGGFGHHGWGGHGQKGHHGKCGFGHHGKGGFGHHGQKGHHGKGGFGHHGKGFPGQHKPMAGPPGMPPFGPPGPGAKVLEFRGPAGGFHPPFAPGMGMKMPSADELFKLFDTNGDGKIDKAEFAAGLKKIREKIEQRMKARFGPQASRGPVPPPAGKPCPQPGPKGMGPKGPQGMHGPGGPHAGPPHKMPSVAEIFAKLDKNKDGKLTKDEVPAQMWEHLNKAGVVKDGAVTKDALEAFHKKMIEQRAKGKAGDKPKPKT